MGKMKSSISDFPLYQASGLVSRVGVPRANRMLDERDRSENAKAEPNGTGGILAANGKSVLDVGTVIESISNQKGPFRKAG